MHASRASTLHPARSRLLPWLWGPLALFWAAACQGEPAWVSDAWVGLLTAPRAGAPTAGKYLHTNSPVQIVERQGTWCRVRDSGGGDPSEGYLPCQVLSPRLLTLADAKGNPGKAFWIAPSFDRLMAYGNVVREGDAFYKMLGRLKVGQTHRFPPRPEFDAAKRLLAEGVSPRPEDELSRGSPVPPAAMPLAYLLSPKPIRPSFFRNQGDVLIAEEWSIDKVAAVTGNRLQVQTSKVPRTYYTRASEGEVAGLSGFGDVGAAVVTYSKPLLRYSVLPNGLVSAEQISKEVRLEVPEEISCVSESWFESDAKPAAGFPEKPASLFPLFRFYAHQALPRKKLTLQGRAVQITDFAKVHQTLHPSNTYEPVQRYEGSSIFGHPDADFYLGKYPKLVLYELDIDGDSVTDILVWVTPWQGGLDTLALSYQWYVNINGQWFSAGRFDELECT